MALAFISSPVNAQVQNQFWKVLSNTLQPVLDVYGLKIPSLGGSGVVCLRSNNVGLVSGSGCGSGTENDLNWTWNPSNASINVATSTNSVGIGTSTPQTKVEIAGNSENTGGILRLTNSDTTIQEGAQIGALQFFSGDLSNDNYRVVSMIQALQMGDGSSQSHKTDLLFFTAPQGAGDTGTSTERMRITGTGLVGIGTTTPPTLLVLEDAQNGSTGAELILSRRDSAIVSGNEYGAVEFYSSDSTIGAHGITARIVGYTLGGTAASLGNVGIYTGTNPASIAENFTFLHSGRLGIGSTTPIATLGVTGNVFAQSASPHHFGTDCLTQSRGGGNQGGQGVEVCGSDNSTIGVQAGVTNINPGTAAYNCWYLNNNEADLLVTKYGAFCLNGGNYTDTSFGTGVAGKSQLLLQNSMNGISLVSSTSTISAAWVNILAGGSASGNEIARFTTTGLGIGTTTPGAKLSVTNTGTGPTAWFSDSTDPDSSPSMIDANGNWGIGNASPLALVDMRHPTTGTSVLLGGKSTGSFAGDNQIYAVDSYNSDVSGGGAGTQGYLRNYSYLTNGAGSYWDIGVNAGVSSTNTLALRAWGNGNVGIGTTSPMSKLFVNGDIKTEPVDWTQSVDSLIGATNVISSGASFDNRLFVGTGDDNGEANIQIFDGSYWTASTTFAANYNTVLSMAPYNGKLYAGLGSDDGEGDIYEYTATSSTWTLSHDGALDGVYSMAAYNGKLYAGMGNDDGEADLYVFDGTSWTLAKDFGDFSATTERIAALEVYNGKLYIGIYDSTNTGLGDVYVYDGSTYALSFNSTAGAIMGFSTYNGKLYVGTHTTSGNTGQHVYVFDGVSWTLSIDFNTSFGSTSRGVTALGAYAGKLYAGLGPTGTAIGDIYVFDGNGWALSRDFGTDEVADFVMYQGKFFALTGNDTTEAEVWTLTARNESLLATSLLNPAFNTPIYEQYLNFTKDITIQAKLGIGTSTPGNALSVQGDALIAGTLKATSTVSFTGLQSATGGTNNDVCITAAGILVNETTGTCIVSSRKEKHDIKDLKLSGLDTILNLRPRSFSMNDDISSDYENMQYGFIAEEVADVDPHLAAYGIDGEARSLDDRAILASVVKAVQEISEIKGITPIKRSMEENWQWIVIGLLALFIGFQQLQISKLKK